MKQAWLNYILHFSSYIYRQKNAIMKAGVIRSVFLSFYIVLLEIILFLISLPTYFLFTTLPDSVAGRDAEMKKYRLQRKVTISVVLTIIGIILLKIVLLFLLTILSGAPTAS